MCKGNQSESELSGSTGCNTSWSWSKCIVEIITGKSTRVGCFCSILTCALNYAPGYVQLTLGFFCECSFPQVWQKEFNASLQLERRELSRSATCEYHETLHDISGKKKPWLQQSWRKAENLQTRSVSSGLCTWDCIIISWLYNQIQLTKICPLLKVKAAKREKQMRASLDTHKRHLALLDAQASPEAQQPKCSALSLACLSPCNPLIQQHIRFGFTCFSCLARIV